MGGLKDKTYRYGGREYTLGQHGFARDKEFELVSNSGTEIWHRLLSDESTRAVYPFEFELETGIRLFRNQVVACTEPFKNRKHVFFHWGASRFSLPA